MVTCNALTVVAVVVSVCVAISVATADSAVSAATYLLLGILLITGG